LGWPPSGDSDGGCRPGVTRATFAFLRMGGTHLTPSKEVGFVMRFHAVWGEVHTARERQDVTSTLKRDAQGSDSAVQ